jgi:hypothetical protein
MLSRPWFATGFDNKDQPWDEGTGMTDMHSLLFSDRTNNRLSMQNGKNITPEDSFSTNGGCTDSDVDQQRQSYLVLWPRRFYCH